MKVRKLSKEPFSYQAERSYYNRPITDLQDFRYIEPYYKVFLGDYCAYFNNKRVLDIGAGECVHGRQVCTSCNPKAYVNLDLFYDRMQVASQHNTLGKMQFVVADCFSLPFNNSSFDVVWGNGILFRLRPLKQVIFEVARVLCPGGVYLGMEPNFANPLLLLKFMLTDRDNRNDGKLTRREVQDSFSNAGMSIDFRFFWKRLPRIRNSFFGTSMGLISKKY